MLARFCVCVILYVCMYHMCACECVVLEDCIKNGLLWSRWEGN